MRGSWGAAPVDGLEPKDGDHVVEKMRMNGFFETRLDVLLRGLGVDTIVVSGAWTNMSIEHTARHGADAGYDGPRPLRRHVDDERGVAGRGAQLRDDERRAGRDLRRDRVRAVLMTTQVPSELLLDRAYIDGQWVDADSGATFAVDQPGDGRDRSPRVPRMGAAETRRAIEAAQRALPGWRGMLAKDRARILRRWADLMLDRQEELATLLTTEQGKPLAESRVEVAYAASFFEWFGEEAKRVYGDTIPTYMADRRIVVHQGAGRRDRRHHAVELPGRDADAQGGAGAGRRLHDGAQARRADAADRARGASRSARRPACRPGVLSIVTGDAEDAPAIGGEMTSNPLVRKLGFTGSTEIGKLLMAQCAGQVKKVSLELGGNAPFIVFDDADLDAAIDGAMTCKFRNSGQTCISANRILVQDAVYDEFAERFTARAAALTVADGFTDRRRRRAADRRAGHRQGRCATSSDARRPGRRACCSAGGRHERGAQFFARPCSPASPTTMAMSCEETFGPVAGISRFSTEDEAVRKANDTPYGLSSYFYSRDIGRIWRVSEALEYGILGINTGVVSTEVAPFGGMKESGIGREGSKYGIDDWLETKYLCLGGMRVIVEERTYHVYTGKLPEVVRLYARGGDDGAAGASSATSSAPSPSTSATCPRSCSCGATTTSPSASAGGRCCRPTSAGRRSWPSCSR